MTTNIRNRLPHLIGASALVVALTGAVSAMDAMSSQTAPHAQASSSAPGMPCKFRVEHGRAVWFPTGCSLPGGGGTSATLDGGLTAVTTMNTGVSTAGATTGGR